MGDYGEILKAARSPVDEASYELATSSPRHIEAIQSELQAAINLIGTLPDAIEAGDALGGIKTALDLDSERYINFKQMLIGYYATLLNTDAALAAAIEQNIETYCRDKTLDELMGFADEYALSEVMLNLERLKELGLTDAQIDDLMDLQALTGELESMTHAEALAFLEELLNSQELPKDSALYQYAKSLENELLGKDPADFAIKKLGDFAKKYIEEVVKGHLPNVTPAQLATLQANLVAAEASFQAYSAKMPPPGRASQKRLRRWFNKHKAVETAQGELNDALALQASTANKLRLTRFAVGGAIFVITMAKEGIDAYNSGLNGQDIMEEIAVAAIDFGIGLGVGALLETGAAALTAAGFTIPGGTVIAVTILAKILVYDPHIKPHIVEWVEEGQDEREQSSWHMAAENEMYANDTTSNWDVMWNIDRNATEQEAPA